MTPSASATSDSLSRAAKPIEVRVGHRELVIRGRYETLSIVNDILIGLIFLVGSILFFQHPPGRGCSCWAAHSCWSDPASGSPGGCTCSASPRNQHRRTRATSDPPRGPSRDPNVLRGAGVGTFHRLLPLDTPSSHGNTPHG